MKITRTAAVALFVALGFKLADKWDNDRLSSKLSKVHENVGDDDINAIADEAVKKDAKAVVAALNAKEAVEITDDGKAEKPAKEGKSEKPAKADKKEKPAKEGKSEADSNAGEGKPEKPAKSEKKDKGEKPAKSDVKRDKFGNREGSQAAQINAQLAKKWTGEDDIAKGAGTNVARVRGHLKWLIGEGYAEKKADENSYRLTGKVKE